MMMAVSSDSSKPNSINEAAEALGTMVEEAAREGRSLYEVEQSIFEYVLQIGHLAVDLFLRGQGDGDLGPEVATAEGRQLFRSEVPVPRELRTVFGLHTFTSFVYSHGPKEKIELRPLDARMELSAGRASYFFEELSQHFCVEQAFGQVAASVHTVLGQKVPVDSLERLNQRVGEQAAEFLDELPAPPRKKEGEVLVFTGDGKGVPLVKRDTAAAAAFQEPPERPGNRRMAILAGVYSVDRHMRTAEEIVAALFRDPEGPPSGPRPKPQFKQLRGCFARTYDAGTDDEMVVPGAIEAFTWAGERVLERLRRKQVLIRLMDGQQSLWNAADACLEELAPEQQVVDILDILHVSQYTWRAATVFCTSKEDREQFARTYLLRILQGGAAGVIAGLRQMATKRGLGRAKRREVDKVCGYFHNNLHRMRYDEYLREGYPIATGVIEGACRHMVKDRMERSGMRWRLSGAQAMLNVRAVWLSSYWKEFHSARITREQSRLHPHRYLVDHYVPTPLAA
jgi:hypothetical protein